ncbi:hypothetical protein CK203_001368 [Vitis vinifera]|uniref:Uncharacterized protein n=1 Tax=Vitis vinifera TaxID=29760 RepID=A0A438KL75_VITVI|nr:hypothetical protein CK203_001368 [Vitis vinifera]
MNLSASSSSSLLSSSPSSSSSSTTSWFSGIVRGRSDKSGSIKMANNSVASDPSGSGGPVNRKNQFHGVLFKYGPKPVQDQVYVLKGLEF